jgi:hypothetical protein
LAAVEVGEDEAEDLERDAHCGKWIDILAWNMKVY